VGGSMQREHERCTGRSAMGGSVKDNAQMQPVLSRGALGEVRPSTLYFSKRGNLSRCCLGARLKCKNQALKRVPSQNIRFFFLHFFN
jgi:hypothetical protein